ncbi:unnamed protein product, partial [Prorocentrum cordatum]
AGLVVVPFAVVAASWPSLGSAIAVHVSAICLHLYKLPWMWEYEFFSLIVELAFVVCACVAWVRTGSELAEKSDTLSVSEVRCELAMEYVAPLAHLAAILALYIPAGVWKLTDNFFDPESSCAPVLFAQLIVRLAPVGLVDDAWMQVLLRAQPLCVALLELSVGPMLWLSPRAGVFAAIAFHTCVALTPPPNNAAGFSVAAGVSLVLCHHRHFAASAARAASPGKPESLLIGLAVAAGVGAAARGGGDWAVAVYAPLAALHFSAVLLSREGPEEASAPRGTVSAAARRAFAAACVMFAFAPPLLGLQDAGPPCHGDVREPPRGDRPAASTAPTYGNHMVLPTGLVQAWGVPPYDGGVVRVTTATSEHVLGHYSAEVTSLFPPAVLQHLRRAGHSGRQFMPYLARVLGPGVVPGGRFLPFEVPVFELRRMLSEAAQRGETFNLSYRRVLGSGDVGPVTEIGAVAGDLRGARCSGECGPEAPHRQGPPPWLASKLSAFRLRLAGAKACLD